MSRAQLVDFEMNEINLIKMDGTVFDKVLCCSGHSRKVITLSLTRVTLVHDQLPIPS